MAASYALVASAVALAHGPPSAATATVLVATACLTVASWRGRSTWAWSVIALAHLRRRTGPGARADAHLLATVTRHSALLDGTAGLAGHGIVRGRGRWSVVLRIRPGDQRTVGPRTGARLAVDLPSAAVVDLPPGTVVVSLVVQSVTGATGRLSAGDRDGAMRRRMWLVVHVHPEHAPRAVVERGGGETAVMRLLARSVSRLTAQCAGQGLSVEPVGRAGVRALVTDLTASDTPTGVPPAGPPRERWRHVVDGQQVHRCLELVGGTADATETTAAVEALCGLPVDQVVATTEVRRDRSGQTTGRVVIRMTGSEDQVDAAGSAVPAIVERHGVRVRFLDGLHWPALLATVPTGGR
ncbi:MAG: type VII secretion protein EccE [Dermatophilaceae bacterium]